MSAKDQMRAMLDQLMGTTRDGNHKRISTSIVFLGYLPCFIFQIASLF